MYNVEPIMVITYLEHIPQVLGEHMSLWCPFSITNVHMCLSYDIFPFNAIRGLPKLTILEEVIIVEGSYGRDLHLCAHIVHGMSHEIHPSFEDDGIGSKGDIFLHAHAHFKCWDVGIGNCHGIILYEILRGRPFLRIGWWGRRLPPIVHHVKVYTREVPIGGKYAQWPLHIREHYVVDVVAIQERQ